MLLFILITETILLGVLAFRLTSWFEGSSRLGEWLLRSTYPRPTDRCR